MTGPNGARGAEEIFSLDALETDDLPPFPFQAGGKTWYLAHPDALDWREQAEIAAAGTNARLLEALLGDQYPDFEKLDLELSNAKIEALVRAAGQFHGITLPESQASPVSSNRAARRSKRTSAKRTASGSRT